jgi:hypothetical protein
MVFLYAVEVDLACLLGCALLVLLDAWGTRGQVYGEDDLRPIYQEEG